MSISNDRPAYRILAVYGFYGPDDHLYGEGEEIYFDGEPNEEMEPLNESARVKLVAYLEKLDKRAQEDAVKTNRPFVGRPRTLDGAIQLATELARSNMVIMGSRKEPTIVERVGGEPIPEVGSTRKLAKDGTTRGRPPGAKNKASLSIAA